MAQFESETSDLQVEAINGVAVLTLNRPEARNALSPAMSQALISAIAWAAAERAIGAVMLTGAGSAFCAGGDVKAMGSSATVDQPTPTFEAQFQALQHRHQGIAGVLRKMSKPSIAALPGAAAGAGMAIALACDMRIAAKSAFLSTGYARIGLSGDYGIAWLLSRTVAPAVARALMLTSERVTSKRALRMGLINHRVDDKDLHVEALALATQLANGPQTAYKYLKQNLDEALEIDHATAIDREADRLLKSRTTQDHKEAVKAFAEKRAPQFVR
ncbi:MAG: enoyl-CoA hydratase-related protein [Pseudomonadaceae bacterium]|nr:enoyl-CoA hydratase-related protein [Pseudomonadaceae bacterium]